MSKRKKFLGFDTSVQDCLSDIGPPQKVSVKRTDQMRIHSAWQNNDDERLSENSESMAACRDYFLNYFKLGFDLLFDGNTHRVKKIILHTNFPGRANFNCYRKCNFRIFRRQDTSNLLVLATCTLVTDSTAHFAGKIISTLLILLDYVRPDPRGVVV